MQLPPLDRERDFNGKPAGAASSNRSSAAFRAAPASKARQGPMPATVRGSRNGHFALHDLVNIAMVGEAARGIERMLESLVLPKRPAVELSVVSGDRVVHAHLVGPDDRI